MVTRLSNLLLCLEEAVSAAIVGTMLGLLCLQITTRYILNSPLNWPEELSGFLFICLTFIAGAAVLKRGGHFSMDALFSAVPASWRKWFQEATNGVILFTALGLAVYAVRLSTVYAGTETRALGIPEEIKTYVMAYAFISMALYCVSRIGGAWHSATVQDGGA